MTTKDIIMLTYQWLFYFGLLDWKVSITTLENPNWLAVTRHGLKRIEYCPRFIDQNIQNRPDLILDTLLHEIAHAITGYRGHDQVWQCVARMLGAWPSPRCDEAKHYYLNKHDHGNGKYTLTKIKPNISCSYKMQEILDLKKNKVFTNTLLKPYIKPECKVNYYLDLWGL